jgi:hypothetical protein
MIFGVKFDYIQTSGELSLDADKIKAYGRAFPLINGCIKRGRVVCGNGVYDV